MVQLCTFVGALLNLARYSRLESRLTMRESAIRHSLSSSWTVQVAVRKMRAALSASRDEAAAAAVAQLTSGWWRLAGK